MTTSNLNNLSVEDKFAKIMIDLRNIRPFYSSLYEVIEKVEDNSIETMAVSLTTLKYNRSFVDSKPLDELMFVVLHEICHIALMHVARAKDKDLDKWNVACDLYVNKLLCEEFDIAPFTRTTNTSLQIKVPNDCCYLQIIDTTRDTAESIYETLVEKEPPTDDELGQDNNTDSSDSKTKNSLPGKTSTAKKYKYKNKTFGADQTQSDILEPHGDPAEIENITKDKINEALVRHSMNSQTAGNTPDDKIITLIKELTKSRINWKKLLRKYCVQATETEYTFNNPDRRLIYTGGIYPGATKSDTSKDLGMIKICMDTSGSVSEKDLNEFYGQVRQLLKSYKLDAEVIYWDSEIASKGKMSTIKELYSLEIKGGGGTNPNCLFEYFDSKQCKLKPNLILIFTDGYFWDDSYKESWVHKYKNTIWVMSREYNKEFKPRFGKLTQAEFK